MIRATYIDHMGSDLSVVNAARVSFGKQSKEVCKDLTLGIYDLSERDKKLISYLAKHRHTSPFGHAFASFHVKAPMFVARQLVRHKFLRWNEISGRYVDFGLCPETDRPLKSSEIFYQPDSWRGKSEDKKQGSSDEDLTEKVEKLAHPNDVTNRAFQEYKYLLGIGVAPEQARMILPMNTMTEWYWSGSLDAFADMCNLRLKEDTQYESRLVAQDIDKIMSEKFPYSWKELVS